MSRLAALLEASVGADAGTAALAQVSGPDRALEVAWLPRTLAEEPAFLIYSITKTFLATLVLRLAEAGRLRLDDPLARWFPRVPGADRIALRHLLHHTAGLRDYGVLPAYHEELRRAPQRPWSFERFLAETVERGPLGAPGERFAYSNPGYMLLRQIAERAGGAAWPELLAEHVTRPLGLVHTVVPETIGDLRSLAAAPSLLLSEDGAPRDARSCYHPGWVSHGVIASTASEVARFLDALLEGRLLGPEALCAMTTGVPVPQAPLPWREPRYGLGLMLDPANERGALAGHGGGGPGWDAAAFRATRPGTPPVTVCALCTVEQARRAEQVAFAALEPAEAS